METDWVEYFTQNRARRPALATEPLGSLAEPLRRALVRSLQRFEVGERGAGRHLLGAARAEGNEAYAQAMEFFVQEEAGHARCLAQAIRALGGTPLRGHWTDACFVGLRRLAGLRTELFVLLTAELIGLHYYRVLRDGIAEPQLQTLFADIVRDEEAHILFHCEALHWLLADLPRPARALVAAAWQTFSEAVSLVVALDHRALLAQLGSPPPTFLAACAALQVQAAAHLRYGYPTGGPDTGHLAVRPEPGSSLVHA
jgi:hypothetical protein